MADIKLTEEEQNILIGFVKRNGITLPEFWGSLTFHFKEGRIIMSNVDVNNRVIVQYNSK